MKTFTFSLCLAFALAFSASAQEAPKNESVEKTAISISKMMVQSMGLNEVEYIQIRNLNHDRLAKAAEATRKYARDETSLESSLREIEEEFESRLFTILNSRQVEAYAKFKAKPEADFLSLVEQVSTKAKK